MKFLKVASLPVIMAISFSANAQEVSNTYAVNRPVSMFSSETPEAAPITNANAVKHFADEYGDLVHENWSAVGRGSRARFEKSGIVYMVDYDKNGKWTNTLRVYQAQELPVNLQELIKSSYPGYSILTTNELTTADQQAYFVQIQNEKWFRTLSIVDGEVKAEKKYMRADK